MNRAETTGGEEYLAIGDAPHDVIGSRMTGGGFGGCTVSLVKTDQAADIAEAICSPYREPTGVHATAFATPPAQGASVLSNNIK